MQPTLDTTLNAQVLSLSDSTKIAFRASTVFPSECKGFPRDFCLRANFRLREPLQRQTYIFTLTLQKYSSVELALSLDNQALVLDYPGNSKTQSVKFDVDTKRLENGAWHSLQICLVNQQAKLFLNCSDPAQVEPLLRPRAEVDVTGNGLLGRKSMKGSKKRQSVFQGSIAELQVLAYSSSVEESFCRTTPSPAAKVSSEYQALGNAGGFDQMPVRVAEESQACDSTGKGSLWYDTSESSMKVCDGTAWTCFGDCRCTMDYIEANQTLLTTNTSDTEFFEIPGKGLFICITQNPDTKGADDVTIIYHLSKGVWSEYQRLKTRRAQDCEFFVMEGVYHISIASLGDNRNKVLATQIFRWDDTDAKFMHKVDMSAARDSAYFCIAQTCFLALAIYSENGNVRTMSIIWKLHNGNFQLHQNIPTQGGYDISYFKVEEEHFLAIANAFDGHTTNVNSVIYKWDEKTSKFVEYQQIPTTGATDWEFFQMKGDSYLIVANSYNHTPNIDLDQPKHKVNSVIYRYDKQSGYFVVFQLVTTYSASKWLHFKVCGNSYLAVANSYADNSEHRVPSKIYRYQGVEKFMEVHSIDTLGAVDWDHIHYRGQDFLSYANSKGESSSILVIKKI